MITFILTSMKDLILDSSVSSLTRIIVRNHAIALAGQEKRNRAYNNSIKPEIFCANQQVFLIIAVVFNMDRIDVNA